MSETEALQEPTRSGPPYKLDDPELRKKLLIYLRLGLSQSKALKRLGIDPHTLRDHCERDAEFAAAFEAAEIDFEIYHLSVIESCTKERPEVLGEPRKHDPSRLKASLEMLGRKFPDEWARKDKHQLSGTLGIAKQFVNVNVDDV